MALRGTARAAGALLATTANSQPAPTRMHPRAARLARKTPSASPVSSVAPAARTLAPACRPATFTTAVNRRTRTVRARRTAALGSPFTRVTSRSLRRAAAATLRRLSLLMTSARKV